MKFSNLTIAGLLMLMFVGVSPVFAQSDRGGITGRVTDQAGAVVPDVKLTALNVKPAKLAKRARMAKETTPSHNYQQ